MLDWICREKGHTDNTGLATDYCKIIRRETQSSYETAIKNFSNWRNGKHTPSQRNFRIISTILEIDENFSLNEKWNEYYKIEKKRTISENIKKPEQERQTRIKRELKILFNKKTIYIATSLTLAIIFLSANLKKQNSDFIFESAEHINMTGKLINWREYTRMQVGQSAVIHGKRGKCGNSPPAWKDITPQLPKLDIGTWSDGGVGYRESNSCQGATPARAIIFTASKPGKERFLLFGDPTELEIEER